MNSLEYIRIGALLTIGALTVAGAAKVLSSNFRRLWRRFLPARFHGDFCHCEGCMRREVSESETARIIARLTTACRELHAACDAMEPHKYNAEARSYVRGKADALGAFADDLNREQREEREGSR